MWSRGKKPIEEVDLTLSSSPSPELPTRRRYKPEPSPSAYAQPAHPKPEPKSNPYRPQTTPFAPKTQHRRPITVKEVPARARAREPQIDPEHLSRIIQTSDPEALRSVLINLCQLSPALGGAVARGLAQSSTFALATINKYRPTPNIKADPDRVNIKSGPKRARSPSDSPELLSSPRIPPYLKHGRSPSPVPSNGSSSTACSDLILLNPIQHDFDILNSHAVVPTASASPPKRLPPNSAASASRSPHPTVIQQAHVKAEPKSRAMVCGRCGDIFEDSNADDGCSFHHGEKRMTDDRVIKWTCCGSGLRGSGCQFDEFHSTSHARDMPRKRTPSYEQPSFPIRTPKNPRLF